MSAPSPTLVLDACTVITFARAGRLDVLTRAYGYRVVMAGRAHAEVRKPPSSTALAAEVEAGLVVVESVDLGDAAEAAALARYDGRPAFRGRGEAEVLTLAAARGYLIVSDENPVLMAALTDLGPGRALTSGAMLKLAVGQGRLSAAEAEALLPSLDVAPIIQSALTRLGMTAREWLCT